MGRNDATPRTERTARAGGMDGYNPGHFDPDTRGGDSRGRRNGDEPANAGAGSPPTDAGAVRSRIAELRHAAVMARAYEPTDTRRLAIDLASAIGWNLADVHSLTFRDVSYIIRRLEERARAPIERGRHGRIRVGSR